MEEKTAQEKIEQLKAELEKARSELYVLYEISNAMRTSLKLEDVLYIILTGVTAHAGLGFNRAMLFLVNEKENIVEGKIGIGPHTGEEANRIWKQIEAEKNTLDDLIENYKTSDKMADSQFNRLVVSLKLHLDERNGGVISLSILENMPMYISQEIISQYASDPLLQRIHMEEFAIVPLRTKDKVIGTIIVDNPFNKKPITKDEIRILTMFANQAGLAIENSQLYEQTVLQAQTDSLTKLWNHGYFQYSLQEEVKKAKENNTSVSLILLDMDNFKELNDALGHQVGDQVLKDIAQLIKDYCRKLDYACRYGGEEFAVVLPQANKKESYLIAERIRQAIEKYHFYDKESAEKKNSISIGVATFPENSIQDKTDLLSFADKALYEAKHSGKNKTCIYNG